MTRSTLGWLCWGLLATACEPTDGILTIAGPPNQSETVQYGTVPTGNETVAGALACDLIDLVGRCNDYIGENWLQDIPLTQRSCESDNGTFRQDWVCPSADRLGVCRIDAAEPDAFNVTYYIGNTWSELDGPDRQRACELENGQWIDAP